MQLLTLAVLAVLAPGYAFVPHLDNDLVAYLPAAWSGFLPDFLENDSPLRASGFREQPGYVAVVRLFSTAFGVDWGVLLLSMTGMFVLVVAIWRLGRAVGLTPDQAFLAAGIAVVFRSGVIGFVVAVPSHGRTDPTPRFLAIAIAVLAVSLVAESRWIPAGLFAVLAASIHPLDGTVVVILTGLSVILARGDIPRSLRAWTERNWSNLRAVLLLALFLVLVGILAGIVTPLVRIPNDVGTAVASGILLIVLLMLLESPSNRISPKGPTGLMLASMCSLFVFGVARSSVGSDSATRSTLEEVTFFDRLFLTLRNPLQVDLSLQQDHAVARFVLLAFIAVVALTVRSRGLHSSPSGGQAARGLAILGVLSVGMIGFASLLQLRAGLPGIASLFPTRHSWIVALVAVLAMASLMPARWVPSPPWTALAVVVLLAFDGLRTPFSLLVTSIAGATAAALLFRRTIARPVNPNQSSREGDRPPSRSTAGSSVLAAMACLAVVAMFSPRPEIRLAESRERFARASSVGEMAALADRALPADSRVLIPPDPQWGAFRILSGRGTAFEWKVWSADLEQWYVAFRQMCDPEYSFELQRDYSSPSREEVAACFRRLDPESIRRIGAATGSTHAVLAEPQSSEFIVVDRSRNGGLVLVELEP